MMLAGVETMLVSTVRSSMAEKEANRGSAIRPCGSGMWGFPVQPQLRHAGRDWQPTAMRQTV
jgi:hypothetical protein